MISLAATTFLPVLVAGAVYMTVLLADSLTAAFESHRTANGRRADLNAASA